MTQSAQGQYAHKLLNDLMENYSSALRPVEDTDRALNVTLQITLSQIKDMVGGSILKSYYQVLIFCKVLIFYLTLVYYNVA